MNIFINPLSDKAAPVLQTKPSGSPISLLRFKRGSSVPLTVTLLGVTEAGNLRIGMKRLAMHNCGKGAKYTRGRGPLELVYTESCPDHSAALKREYAVKHLPREAKEALISAWNGPDKNF